MKPFVFGAIIAALSSLASCSDNNANTSEQSIRKDTIASPVNVDHRDSSDMATTQGIVSGYLNLKNALADDNGREAADAANAMKSSLQSFNETGLPAEQKKVYDDVKDDLKEHAEHIGANGSNISHQREHFEMMSQDMIDLVKSMGSNQSLYRDYCPMYNNSKGAFWLSESKEIKNPYLGKKMPGCGEVKEELKAKE